MKHYCLIGGGGFIGVHVANTLLLRGQQVTILDTRPAPSHLTRGAQYRVGDYSCKETLRKVLPGIDSVINLSYASVPSTSIKDPVQDILSNLPAAVNLLEVAGEYAIQKIVQISSGGTVYGPAQELPLTEDHPTNPISPYGVTKLAIEKYGLMFCRLKDLPVVTVRPANAFGEHQNPFLGQGFIAAAMAAILDRQAITLYGAQGTIRDYVHVQDVAGGIVAASEHGHPGSIYNLGSGLGRSNKDVLEEIRPHAEALGFSLQMHSMPARRFDVEANVLDSHKLRSVTGWNIAIPFPEGIRRTWEWFVNNRDGWAGLRDSKR